MQQAASPLALDTPDSGQATEVEVALTEDTLRADLLLLAGLLTPQITVAQAPLSGNAWKLDSLTFAKLRSRLSSRDSVRVHGAIGTVYLRRPTLTRDSLLGAIDHSGTPGVRVGLVDVTRIQVLGNASRTGTLIGAGVGFTGGLAAGLGLAASLCSDGGCTNETGGVAVITVGSLFTGALLGALIGTQVKKWHTVYQVP
jgi:hypothetical protein